MVSTAVLSQYLDGLDFPASKAEVLSYAEDRGSPTDVLRVLEEMPGPPDGRYYSLASIWDAAGAIA